MTITILEGYRYGESSKTNGKYTSSRQYQAHITAPESFEALSLRIGDNPEIPQVGSAISSDYPNVLVTSVTPKEINEGDWTKWKITVNYETRAANVREPIDPTADPTDLPALTSSYSVRRNEVMEFAYQDGDIEGFPTKPVVNTEGDPFDPPLQNELSNQMLVAQVNLRKFDKSKIREFENTINNQQLTFIGVSIPRFCGFISEISSQSATDGKGRQYYIVSYKIEVSEKPFIKRIENAGFNKRIIGGSAGQKEPIIFGDIDASVTNPDEKVDDAQRLNANGAVIVSPETPSHILEFNNLFAKSWSPLNLQRNE